MIRMNANATPVLSCKLFGRIFILYDSVFLVYDEPLRYVCNIKRSDHYNKSSFKQNKNTQRTYIQERT